MKKVFATVGLLALAAGVATMIPDLVRYIKISAM